MSTIPTSTNSGRLLSERVGAARAKIHTTLNATKGTLVFRAIDINKTLNPISRLLRMIFVHKNVTLEHLKDCHERYTEKEGKLPKEINNDRNNIKKALFKSRMTIHIFERLLMILGYCIEDIELTIKNIETGEKSIYRLSDATLYTPYCNTQNNSFLNENNQYAHDVSTEKPIVVDDDYGDDF
jgi:hypothetical protein